ncbi:hypothetical protein TNCV_4498081 [Trichonephila clavipes]|nr:hypothetical protein TNCV_4498081 [Trichonephila clavipes]
MFELSSDKRLEEGEEASDHPQSILPLNRSGTEPNRTITYMVLKATANDNTLCHDEFLGLRSALCQSGGITTDLRRSHLYTLDLQQIHDTPATSPLP